MWPALIAAFGQAASAPKVSSSPFNTSGSMYQASGDGDWNVNFGGAMSSANGINPWILVALGVGVAWIAFKR